MGKRPAASKATRGVAKAKNKVQSSSSNPKTRKFRSKYNDLAVIAKGGPSKKSARNESFKNAAKEVLARRRALADMESVDMIEHGGAEGLTSKSDGKTKGTGKTTKRTSDNLSNISEGTQQTTASFASVWSQCTNSSLNEFFQVWDPKLETHKDALAVVAGLSQAMSESGTEQSDFEFTKKLYKILSSEETPINVITGTLLALTFVMRKLSTDTIVENFDQFYPTLKVLMEKYHNCKRKTLVKCLLRCFSCLTKSHPMGKEAIESGLRKMINIAIRQYKVQSKIQL